MDTVLNDRRRQKKCSFVYDRIIRQVVRKCAILPKIDLEILLLFEFGSAWRVVLGEILCYTDIICISAEICDKQKKFSLLMFFSKIILRKMTNLGKLNSVTL